LRALVERGNHDSDTQLVEHRKGLTPPSYLRATAPTSRNEVVPKRERESIMAGGVNKVILVGNLGSDPEMRYTPSGQGVCEFRVATNESWNDKNGQRQERTEWHRIIVWGKRAEVCSKYLSKG